MNYVPSAHLLEQPEQDTEHEAVEELVLAHGEDVLHAGRGVSGLFKGELNTADFCGNHGVILWETAEPGQTGTGLLSTSLAAKPARRLGDQEDGRDQDDRDENREDQGDAPLNGEEVDFEETKVDPGLEKVTQTDKAAVEHCVGTTVLGSGALRLPDGDRRRELTYAPSEDETSDDELCDVERGALEDLADQGETSGREDQLAATKTISKERAGESTKKRADGKHGDYCALNGFLGLLDVAGRSNGVHLGERGCEVTKRKQTTDTRLVVTEQDEGK